MDEQKHFSYEAQKPVVTVLPIDTLENAKVIDVSFLTPAKVSFTIKGEAQEEMVNIDLIDRVAYLKNGQKAPYSDNIFNYLNSINELDLDFFRPSEDIYKQTEEIMKQHDSMKEEVGDE